MRDFSFFLDNFNSLKIVDDVVWVKIVKSEKYDGIFYLVETKHETRMRQDFII